MTSSLSARLRPRRGRSVEAAVWMGSHCRQDVNDSSHSSKAVQGAEIVIHARLRKSEFIHEPCVIKDSGVTVHVIRRTKLPIVGAGRATGDTVRIAGQVQRTVSPTLMVTVSGTKVNSFSSGPTVTSKIWLPTYRFPLGAWRPY